MSVGKRMKLVSVMLSAMCVFLVGCEKSPEDEVKDYIKSQSANPSSVVIIDHEWTPLSAGSWHCVGWDEEDGSGKVIRNEALVVMPYDNDRPNSMIKKSRPSCRGLIKKMEDDHLR